MVTSGLRRKELLLECLEIIDNLSDEALEETLKALKKIKEPLSLLQEPKDQGIIIKTNHQAILNLLDEWKTEGDAEEQTDTLNYLLENLPSCQQFYG